MRVLTNEQHIRRNRTLAQVLFFASLVLLIGGLLITNTIGRNSDFLAVLPCLIMPIALVTTWISVRMTNEFVRLPHPEDAIQNGLKGAAHNSILYNYLFKAKHVLVCPQGVYAITTRFQDGVFSVNGETWTNRKRLGLLGRWLTFMRQEQMGDPFRDAREAAADLQKRVDEALPGEGITVQPVVVFTSDKVALELIDPALPVVLANAKKKPSLKALVRDPKKRGEKLLSVPQINKLEAALNSDLAIEEEASDADDAD